MQNNELMLLIKRNFGGILISGFLLAALSFSFLIFNEKNFKVNTEFLIVQNQSGAQDAYTLSKSAEYLGKVLSESAYSELFINEVIKTGKVDASMLPANKKDKIEQWSKMVNVNRNSELGMISAQVFNDNQQEALAVSEAIAQVLTEKNSLFRGDGQNIEVKILSGPVWERNPSITNLTFAVAGGFIIGLMLGFMKVYYSDAKKTRAFKYPAFTSNEPIKGDERYLEELKESAK